MASPKISLRGIGEQLEAMKIRTPTGKPNWTPTSVAQLAEESIGAFMPTFTYSDVLYFLAFVVPGFISMQIYVQIRPRQKTTLKDSLLEAFTFGAMNFVLLFFQILWTVKPASYAAHPFGVWVSAILIFFVAPTIWPWLLIFARTFWPSSICFWPLRLPRGTIIFRIENHAGFWFTSIKTVGWAGGSENTPLPALFLTRATSISRNSGNWTRKADLCRKSHRAVVLCSGLETTKW